MTNSFWRAMNVSTALHAMRKQNSCQSLISKWTKSTSCWDLCKCQGAVPVRSYVSSLPQVQVNPCRKAITNTCYRTLAPQRAEMANAVKPSRMWRVESCVWHVLLQSNTYQAKWVSVLFVIHISKFVCRLQNSKRGSK